MTTEGEMRTRVWGTFMSKWSLWHCGGVFTHREVYSGLRVRVRVLLVVKLQLRMLRSTAR